MADRTRQKVQDTADKAQQPGHEAFQQLRERSPSARQVVGLLTLLALGTAGLFVGGLTIGGICLALLALSPVLLFFSPILVPLATVAAFTIGGLLFAGVSALAAVSGLSWLYNYFKGRHPPGSDQVDSARSRLQETAAHVKERAREYGSNVTGYLQSKPQEVAPGA